MVDLSRRQFLKGKPTYHSRAVVRLPWSKGEAVFTDLCQRCYRCVDACSENIITKGDGQYPEISFTQSGCSFCQECLIACSEPLFINASENPWQHTFYIDKTSCLTYQNILCQSCQDICDQQAINFQSNNIIPLPVLEADSCNGCGMCVSVCPAEAIQFIAGSTGEDNDDRAC